MPIGLPAEERRFIRSFVKLGGVDEKIRDAERAARVKVGSGAKMLKLKRVQEAVKAQMEPIRLEQERQKLVGSAVVAATATLQQEVEQLKAQLAQATTMPDMEVTGNEKQIERELMRLVRLCPEKHGRIKLASIQTAFVVAGLMEQGSTRRVTPPENPLNQAATGIYTNVFDRLRQERAAALETGVPAPVPVIDADAVFDLTPQKVEPIVAPQPLREMPAAGESIDPEPEVVPTSKARVITVEIH